MFICVCIFIGGFSYFPASPAEIMFVVIYPTSSYIVAGGPSEHPGNVTCNFTFHFIENLLPCQSAVVCNIITGGCIVFCFVSVTNMY